MDGEGLAGRRILVVEDNFNIAAALARLLRARGAEIVGPAATVKDALTIIANNCRIDGAVLDINLRDELVYPVVDALRLKSVRAIFMTGYDSNAVKPPYADVPCLQKPIGIEQLIQALFG